MEAERVHALPVDMNRRGDMVVDFALSGCLTIKAIGDYAKDLQTLTEPDQAYEMFADLAVRRTWGGLPPWSDLIAQLKRLGKATDVTADEAIYDFVKATIDAPAIERRLKLRFQSHDLRPAILESGHGRRAIPVRRY